MPTVWLKNVGDEDECWIVCAKGDPGATEFVSKSKCGEDCPGDDTCERNKYCMCGDLMQHSDWAGHTPISMHRYYTEKGKQP